MNTALMTIGRIGHGHVSVSRDRWNDRRVSSSIHGEEDDERSISRASSSRNHVTAGAYGEWMREGYPPIESFFSNSRSADYRGMRRGRRGQIRSVCCKGEGGAMYASKTVGVR